MALQSSGQISLSQIATEFGGSAPHALSEYYGAASGVPTSGQIRLAADFYGTSSIIHSSTITPGTVTQKSGAITIRGYDRSGTINGSNIGNISTTAISGTSRIVTMVIDQDDTTTVGYVRHFEIRFNATFTGFTKIRINGSTELTRASATVVGLNNEGYRWAASTNAQYPVPTSFEIIP